MTTRMTGIKLIWLAFYFTTTACQEYPTSSYEGMLRFTSDHCMYMIIKDIAAVPVSNFLRLAVT